MISVRVETIFCGIIQPVAQVMVSAGIEMKGFRISRDLKSAIKIVFEMQGIKLVKIEPEGVQMVISKPVTIKFSKETGTVEVRDMASELASGKGEDEGVAG